MLITCKAKGIQLKTIRKWGENKEKKKRKGKKTKGKKKGNSKWLEH